MPCSAKALVTPSTSSLTKTKSPVAATFPSPAAWKFRAVPMPMVGGKIAPSILMCSGLGTEICSTPSLTFPLWPSASCICSAALKPVSSGAIFPTISPSFPLDSPIGVAVRLSAAFTFLARSAASPLPATCKNITRGVSPIKWLCKAVISIPSLRSFSKTGPTSSSVSTKSPSITALSPPSVKATQLPSAKPGLTFTPLTATERSLRGKEIL